LFVFFLSPLAFYFCFGYGISCVFLGACFSAQYQSLSWPSSFVMLWCFLDSRTSLLTPVYASLFYVEMTSIYWIIGALNSSFTQHNESQPELNGKRSHRYLWTIMIWGKRIRSTATTHEYGVPPCICSDEVESIMVRHSNCVFCWLGMVRDLGL
jgi:hypothetical protein